MKDEGFSLWKYGGKTPIKMRETWLPRVDGEDFTGCFCLQHVF